MNIEREIKNIFADNLGKNDLLQKLEQLVKDYSALSFFFGLIIGIALTLFFS